MKKVLLFILLIMSVALVNCSAKQQVEEQPSVQEISPGDKSLITPPSSNPRPNTLEEKNI